MKSPLCALVSALLALPLPASAGAPLRVTGDRVNLRSMPNDQSEVVLQVSKGDTLVAEKDEEGDWIAVAPPSGVGLYVYSELVRNGAVAVEKAQIRSGPGIAYRAVGVVESGARLVVMEDKGEWLKVAPPPGCVLWVSRKFVEPIASTAPAAKSEPPAKEPEKPAAKPPIPTTSRKGATDRNQATSAGIPPANNAPTAANRPPAIPFEKRLIETMEQGKPVQYDGVVGYSSYVLRRPSRYILMMSDARGRAIGSAYIYGGDLQFEALVGRHVTVSGKEFWLQGVRSSVVVPDRVAVVEQNRGE